MDVDTEKQKMSAAKEKKPAGYDSTKTRVSRDKITAFAMGPHCGSLLLVPGIGEANERIMKENEIYSLQQLLGVFMSLASAQKITPTEHKKLMYNKLVEMGINSSRSDICDAMQEKIWAIFTDFYDVKS